VIDVGSGGGFPALIVAALRPALAVRCVEPIHKKTAFLSAAVRSLKLGNVTVVTRRVDEGLDHGFDAAFSRATFALDEWLALGERLVRSGGMVIGMEAREQIVLGPNDQRHPYALAGRQRALIVRRVP
jgi:16S rRNA (guanine527-N7)-methyltransferase